MLMFHEKQKRPSAATVKLTKTSVAGTKRAVVADGAQLIAPPKTASAFRKLITELIDQGKIDLSRRPK